MVGEIGLAVENDIIKVILSSTYFRWVLLLVLIAIVGSIVSGLIEAVVLVAKYGAILLFVVGLLEFIAPEVLGEILNNLFGSVVPIQEYAYSSS